MNKSAINLLTKEEVINETDQVMNGSKDNFCHLDIGQPMFRHVNIDKAKDDVTEEDVKNEEAENQKDSFSQESFSCYDQSVKIYSIREIAKILQDADFKTKKQYKCFKLQTSGHNHKIKTDSSPRSA